MNTSHLSADYQWPAPLPESLPPLSAAGSRHDMQRCYEAIEAFFSERYQTPAILMPSGRAVLGAVLRFHEFNRSHVISAPMWSSHCIWGTIGVASNPTLSKEDTADAILIVHKWGYPVSLNGDSRGVLIDDSVDSAFDTADSFFLNADDFEMMSLPKVMASFSGAIVLTRNDVLQASLRHGQFQNIELGQFNSRLKYRYYRGELQPHESWDATEHANTSLDMVALTDIENRLDDFNTNISVIKGRLTAIQSSPLSPHLPSMAPGRYPCVAPFPTKLFNPDGLSTLMVRNFNVSQLQDRPSYEPCYLLPLNFSVSEQDFEICLTKLSSNLNG